ncbi:hypothetical protein GYMLUDRAFT_236858 [Collybiopsis luxurians FD-317 M1]|nr:hypothetical protein GYMLUDRAFT_236858 [Collybiopsis luxurians FD-317 M1]
MGLAGRKVKQRIGPDPRNLTWADDASKFGASYLAKFGWDSSKGLGLEGQGRTSHIKVSQKLDMLGIGAAQSKDPNGIAWKQNKDFESLLKRLNENASTPALLDTVPETSGSEDVVTQDKHEKESKEERKQRRREEKERKKETKKKRKREDDEAAEQRNKKAKSEEGPAPKTERVEELRRAIPRHRAHRARAIAAKNISSKSAASIAEVLGIASSTSSSSTHTPTPTPSGSLTPLTDDVGLEKLTTSAKSVADYFKERLSVKACKSSPLSSAISPETAKRRTTDDGEEDAPRAGLGSLKRSYSDTDDDAPRAGLGSARATFASATPASSSFSLEMSKIASMFSSAINADVGLVPKDAIDNDSVHTCDDKEQEKKERKRADLAPEANKIDANDEREDKLLVSKKTKKREKGKEKEKTGTGIGDLDAAVLDEKAAKRKAKDERKREKKEKKRRKGEGSD